MRSTRTARQRVDSTGSVPQVICKVPAVAVGGSWSADGAIVAGNTGGGLLRCPASGGDAAPVTAKVSDGNQPRFICFRRFSLTTSTSSTCASGVPISSRAGVYLADLSAAARTQRDVRRRLSRPKISVPSSAGVPGAGVRPLSRSFAEGALMVASFDVERGVVTGEPSKLDREIGTGRRCALSHVADRAGAITPSPRSRN